MTKETRLRIAMETLVDTMIDSNNKRMESVNNFKSSNLSLDGKRALVMNENMMYMEDLNRAINFTMGTIESIFKEEK